MLVEHHISQPHCHKVFQIVITAIRGPKNEGYVALDDFSFRNNEEFCSTKPEDAAPTTTLAPTEPTTKVPQKLPNCQFEDNTCDWEVFGNEFRW